MTVRFARAALVAAVLVLGSACGDDDADASRSMTTSPTRDDSAVILVLDEQQICDDLPGADVADALDVNVTASAVGGSPTAQCAYTYTAGSAQMSTITVASMSSEVDLGGRSGREAFDYIVELNRGVAGGTSVDEEGVPVGERAVRLTGSELHLGVISSGGHLLTVIVPVADVDGQAVDRLMGVVAERFATSTDGSRP